MHGGGILVISSQIYLDNKSIAKARAVSKKKAEEKAAKIAASILKPSKTKKDA